MRTPVFLLFLCSAMVSICLTGAAQAQQICITTGDKAALEAIEASNADLVLFSWLDNLGAQDTEGKHCSERWDGSSAYSDGRAKVDASGTVVINPDGRVTELILHQKDLQSIPNELGELNKLQRLKITNNKELTILPATLSFLTDLVYLNLSQNALTDTEGLFQNISALESLKELHLGFNQLTGGIPTEIGKLGNLTHLYLLLNQLSKPIPTEIGKLGNLIHLHLGANQLTGAIPTEIGNLEKLERLLLYSNQLTGTIPTNIGNLENLKLLFLDRNQLTGYAPLILSTLPNLEIVELRSTGVCDNPDDSFQEWMNSINYTGDIPADECPSKEAELIIFN